MNWSNEWPKSPTPPVWPIGDPKSVQIRDMGAEAGMPPIDQSIKAIELSIIVNHGDFSTTLEAIQIGDLAVHHDIKCKKEGFWQVTHMPTLTRFNVVPHGLHKQSDLIQWCKNVQASFVEDWKELAKLDPSSYSMRSEAKDRIMVLCQGTKI